MAQNPFKMLIQSRKFWVAVVDAVAAILGLWIGAYADPKLATLIMATWGAIQPVLIVMILMIGYEDKARLEAASVELQEKNYAARTAVEAKKVDVACDEADADEALALATEAAGIPDLDAAAYG